MFNEKLVKMRILEINKCILETLEKNQHIRIDVVIKLPNFLFVDYRVTHCCLSNWYPYEFRKLFKKYFSKKFLFIDDWELTFMERSRLRFADIHSQPNQIALMVKGQVIPKLCGDECL